MKKTALTFNILICAVVLSACNDDGPSTDRMDSSNTSSSKTGIFLDSPVANIGYRTETLEGVTNSLGEYEYIEGETVIFYIGDLELPSVAAKGTVTPLDLANTKDTSADTVVNIIRLLQTLDEDANPENGITISDVAKSSASQVNFQLTAENFAISTAVTSLVANSGSSNVSLIAAEDAINHLEESLLMTEGKGFSTLIPGTYLGYGSDDRLPTVMTFNADLTGSWSYGIDESGPITWSVDSDGVLILNFTDTGEVEKSTLLSGSTFFGRTGQEFSNEADKSGYILKSGEEQGTGFKYLGAGTYQTMGDGNFPTTWVLNDDLTGEWSYPGEGSEPISWSVREDGVLVITSAGGEFEEFTLTSGDFFAGDISIVFSNEPDSTASWIKVSSGN